MFAPRLAQDHLTVIASGTNLLQQWCWNDLFVYGMRHAQNRTCDCTTPKPIAIVSFGVDTPIGKYFEDMIEGMDDLTVVDARGMETHSMMNRLEDGSCERTQRVVMQQEGFDEITFLVIRPFADGEEVSAVFCENGAMTSFVCYFVESLCRLDSSADLLSR